MTERSVVLGNVHGLHARPAAEFVKLASRFVSDVKLSKGDLTIDGKSIMGVMMLAAAYGTRIRVEVDGDDEAEALAALEALVASRFEEDQ